MKERIKDLADQCWSHRVDGTLVDGQLHFDEQKFARLLILECIELVETTPTHCAFTTYDLPTVECTIQKSSERLYNHFGIQRTYRTTDERTRVKEIPNTRRSL